MMIHTYRFRLSAIRAVILAVGLLAAAAPVAAQNSIPNATLTVSGNVPGITQIFVENVSGNTGFDLTLNQGITQIATIRERSNKKSGYKVMVTSANLNAGNCTTDNTKACFYNATDSEELAFEIYKGTSTSGLILAASPPVNSGNWTTSTNKTTGQGISNDAKVSFTGDLDLSEGSYTETLTFTITANP